jgi:hypothetical protein
MHSPPTIAQNELPVIDEPWIRFSPCPSQTAPRQDEKRSENAPRNGQRLAAAVDGDRQPVENRLILRRR